MKKGFLKKLIIWLSIVTAVLAALWIAWIYVLQPLVAKLLAMLGFAKMAGKIAVLGKVAGPGKLLG